MITNKYYCTIKEAEKLTQIKEGIFTMREIKKSRCSLHSFIFCKTTIDNLMPYTASISSINYAMLDLKDRVAKKTTIVSEMASQEYCYCTKEFNKNLIF